MTEICLETESPTLNSTNFNDNFKDNVMQEIRNKMASKAKTLNICALESIWKWTHGDLILSHKIDSHEAIPDLNQHWLY